MRGLFFAGMVLGSAILATAVGPTLEGRFFPVVTTAHIDRVETASPVASRIWGRFDRLRDCSFEGLHFYLGTPDASARADLVFEEPAQVRLPGSAEFGPWLIQLTPDQLASRAYAIAYHRCHPFWITETWFFPE